jgi:hypothetical protein
MKKLVLAAILAVSSQFALANTSNAPVDPQFAKIEEMVNAKNFKGAYDALSKLASQGNAQAIYNLGYLTQTGQGLPRTKKRLFSYMNRPPAKVIQWPTMYWARIIPVVL